MTFKVKNTIVTPTLQSTISTGTAPFIVASTTRVSNLNVATAGTADSVVATVTGTNSVELVRGNMGDNDQARILVGATGTNAGFLEIATADDGTEPIHVRQYTGTFGSITRTATLLDGSGNTSFPGTVTAAGFSGNATTATTLQTARTINGTSFNGSANITITANTPNTLTMGVSGTGLSGSATFNGGSATTFTVTSNATSANTVSAIVARDANGDFSARQISANLLGNASSLAVPDTRNVTTTPETINVGVLFDFKANTSNALSDGGTYHGLMTFRQYGSGTDWSGGRSHQLGFTDNENLWHRSGTSTTWGTWRKIYETDDAATANTANTLVLRDGSGNFSAGTITASLTGTATQANNLNGGSAQAIVYQSTAGTTAFLAAGTSGQVLTSNGSGSAPTWQTAAGSMVYPSAGIPNSTGTAWGTSYTTSGTGTVVALTTSPTFITPTLGVASATSLTATGTISGLSLVATSTAANTSYWTGVGYSLTGSNATPMIDLNGTWNTTGAPSAIKINIINTASNSGSRLLELNNNGGTRFAVGINGDIVSTVSDNFSYFTGFNYSLTGSNAQSVIDLNGVWNTTGTPTAIKLNLINAASNASSRLLDLIVNGNSRFNIAVNGALSVNNSYGTSGQVLSSNGSGSAPTWKTDSIGAQDYIVQSFGIV